MAIEPTASEWRNVFMNLASEPEDTSNAKKTSIKVKSLGIKKIVVAKRKK